MESYVTQETHLFHDSIANNIAIGKPGASRKEIIEAAKKASIHNFIQTLPDGYDTKVGELGDTLSGGERQRIGIARAFREGAAGDTAHFGTRCYAPPEQFGYGQTDERSDVYALGMLLYYLLAERDPSPSVAAAGFAGPEVPFALRPVLQRACAFDPAARFQTVRDLKAAFLAALAPAGASPADRGVVVTQVAGAGRVSPADWAATAVSAAAPIDDRPHGVVVSRVRRAFSTLSSGETAGLVVDVALLVVWLLFMAVLIAMPFTPDERYATWPFWLLAFQYWTFGIPFFTGFLFILTDVRVLRRAAPRLRLLQGARLRILGIALVVVGVIAVGVTMAIANAMGLPTGS